MCYISFALSIVLQNVEKNEDNNVNCILVRNSYQGFSRHKTTCPFNTSYIVGGKLVPKDQVYVFDNYLICVK